MQIHITMDKDNTRPELRRHDVREVVAKGQSAEDRVRRFLDDHAEQIPKAGNPLEAIAVDLVDDKGLTWRWKGWGHEKLIRSSDLINKTGWTDGSAQFQNYAGE